MKIGKHEISILDLSIAFVLLILTAVFVFGFFTLLTDAIRYVTLDPYDKELIFSGEYRLYFNLFYAGLGLLIGQSFALYYLLPRLPLPSYFKTQILNDNQWVIWSVLLLVIKGIAILVSYRMIFMSDSLTAMVPLIVCIMLTILGVMFIYSWNGIRRYILGTRIMVLMVGFLFYSSLSFLIAHISFIDRQTIDEMALNNNVVHTHDIQYPEAEWGRKIKRKSLVIDLVIGKNPKTQEVEVFYENNLVPLNSLDSVLFSVRNSFRMEELKFTTIGLRADKHLKVKDILPILERLYISGQKRILFYVNIFDEPFMADPVFSFKLSEAIFYDYLNGKLDSLDVKKTKYSLSTPPLHTIISNYYIPNNGVDVYVSQEKSYINQHEKFSVLSMTNKLSEAFKQDEASTITFYFVDENITLGEYINTKSQIYKAYHELRNEYAMQHFSKFYEDLNSNNRRSIRKQYPINIMEFGLKSINKERMDAFFIEQKELYHKRWMWICLP